MLKSIIVAASVICFSAPSAFAQAPKDAPKETPVSIQEIKAQLFLERTGRLSENIVGSKKKFHNTILGEGDAGEPSDSILVTFVFHGPKNGKASDKLARDLAAITVTQKAKTGERVILKKAMGGFLFSDTGVAYKSVYLENATCAPLDIEVKLGKAKKNAKIDFTCGE